MKPPSALPKIKRGTIMPKDIIDLRKEGKKYISDIDKQIKNLGVLNESVKELEKQLASLKERRGRIERGEVRLPESEKIEMEVAQ